MRGETMNINDILQKEVDAEMACFDRYYGKSKFLTACWDKEIEEYLNR
jgi:hypothetical protein